MPRLEICNCDLHWQWINWTLLFDTMEVSMVRLASLAIAQHVFQPALTGRPESGPESISRKIVSCEREQRLYRGEQISRKNVSRESNELPRFREKYRAHGRQKWGPTCDRDISNSAIYTTAIYRAYTVSKYQFLLGIWLWKSAEHIQTSRYQITELECWKFICKKWVTSSCIPTQTEWPA